MFLESPANTLFSIDGKWKQDKSPLHWFAHVTKCGNVSEIDGIWGTRLFVISVPGFAFALGRLHESWRYDTASWRRIRIADYGDGGTIRVEFWTSAQYGTYHCLERFTERKVFGAGSTLGEVYDAVVEIDSRGAGAHGDAMGELVEESER